MTPSIIICGTRIVLLDINVEVAITQPAAEKNSQLAGKNEIEEKRIVIDKLTIADMLRIESCQSIHM